LSEDDAATIYQLRNAVLHSFGWYSSAGNTYRFRLASVGGPLVDHLAGSTEYTVDVVTLRADFDTAIAAYRAALRDNETGPDDVTPLQDSFMGLFDRYGVMGIG
jgi:hypothetical protein